MGILIMVEENGSVVSVAPPVDVPAEIEVRYDKSKYSNIHFDADDQKNSVDKYPVSIAGIMRDVGIPQDKAQPLFDKLCESHNVLMGVVDKTINNTLLKYTEERKAKLDEQLKTEYEANEALISKEFGDERQKIVDHAVSKAKGFGFEGEELKSFVDGVNGNLTTLRFIKNYMSEHKDTSTTPVVASKSDDNKEHGTARDLLESSLRM
jgi:hypothetical protein